MCRIQKKITKKYGKNLVKEKRKKGRKEVKKGRQTQGPEERK